MSENSKIGGWNRERDLSESGVEGFNVDNGVLLVVKPKSAQQTVNLDIWVGRPDADVVTVLVIDTGTRDVEFQVNTVPFRIDVEELTSDGDGGREGVLGVVDTLRPCQSSGGEFSCKVSVSRALGVRGRTNPSRPSPRDGNPTR